MAVNQLSYKVLSERSILVFPDNAAEARAVRRAGDADVLRVARRRHRADAAPQLAASGCPAWPCSRSIQSQQDRQHRSPCARPRRSSQIIEKIIPQNDKPRAEIVIDVEILEVNRQRAKQYGLNLSEYAIGGILSPEVSPSGRRASRPARPRDRRRHEHHHDRRRRPRRAA